MSKLRALFAAQLTRARVASEFQRGLVYVVMSRCPPSYRPQVPTTSVSVHGSAINLGMVDILRERGWRFRTLCIYRRGQQELLVRVPK